MCLLENLTAASSCCRKLGGPDVPHQCLIEHHRSQMLQSARRRFSVLALDHPRFIRVPNVAKWTSASKKLRPFHLGAGVSSNPCSEVSSLEVVSTEEININARVLTCPASGCTARYTQNRKDRLCRHVRKCHSEEAGSLLIKVDQVFPSFKPKARYTMECTLCCVPLTGSERHKKVHEATFKHLKKEFADINVVNRVRVERLAVLHKNRGPKGQCSTSA